MKCNQLRKVRGAVARKIEPGMDNHGKRTEFPLPMRIFGVRKETGPLLGLTADGMEGL